MVHVNVSWQASVLGRELSQDPNASSPPLRFIKVPANLVSGLASFLACRALDRSGCRMLRHAVPGLLLGIILSQVDLLFFFVV